MEIDWGEMWIPTHAIAEMVVRGTIMYLALFVMLRFLGRRQTGSLGTADVLVIVLLADAAQNGMSNDYKSIPEGLVLVATILGWDYLIDWIAFRFPAFGRRLEPAALPLIRAGRVQRRNMRKEMITNDELMSQLREAGVETVADVKLAQLESDGRISVVRADKTPTTATRKKVPGA